MPSPPAAGQTPAWFGGRAASGLASAQGGPCPMFLRTGELTVHVQVAGPEGAPPLLLLHSLGTSLHVWDAQAAALSPLFRVIRPDMRGHGLTTVTPGPYSLHGLAADALAVLDALGIARAHVGGLSIGGAMAQ